jgi:hypothetical protein
MTVKKKYKRHKPIYIKPADFKQQIERLYDKIARKFDRKRPENYLSDAFDVEVYAVRQWTVRGIPKRFRDQFAELVGISRNALNRLHGEP